MRISPGISTPPHDGGKRGNREILIRTYAHNEGPVNWQLPAREVERILAEGAVGAGSPGSPLSGRNYGKGGRNSGVRYTVSPI